MRRLAYTLALSLCVLLGCACEKESSGVEPAPESLEGNPGNTSTSDDKAEANPTSDDRGTSADAKKAALVEALEQHKRENWDVDGAGVPEWFFRPEERLRAYLPNGEPQEWQAQFDCSGSKMPACNLHYEVDVEHKGDEQEVVETASGVTELGFQLVQKKAPSFKAIRPVERANAVDVVYVNQPPDMGSVEMIAVLRQPVEPTVTSLLAQPSFEPVAKFAVDVVSVPNSINVEKPRYEETIAYSVIFDLPEGQRSDVESYLKDVGFELVRRGEAEATTSKWRHPSGWKASLEGDESIYQRFLIYFTRYAAPDAESSE